MERLFDESQHAAELVLRVGDVPGFAYGEMMMHGTRMPRPTKSSCGGGTLSYHPPQSSHSTTIAVVFQYWLSPIALTTPATHDGPLSLCVPA